MKDQKVFEGACAYQRQIVFISRALDECLQHIQGDRGPRLDRF